MICIDGKKIAEDIFDRLRQQPIPNKILAVVWVGENSASRIFIDQKKKAAQALGVSFALHHFTGTESSDVVHDCIRALSRDDAVQGIVLQLPVPAEYNRDALIAEIDILKDVDNLTGKAKVEAPAVGAVKEIIRDSGFKTLPTGRQVQNSRILVVGRGFLVGAPILAWLKQERFRVTVADINTKDLPECVQNADLIITGVGKEGLIDLRWLKAGAGIIDFGFPPDFRYQASDIRLQKLSFYTPTPGGTGPIVVAKLLENFYTLNCG